MTGSCTNETERLVTRGVHTCESRVRIEVVHDTQKSCERGQILDQHKVQTLARRTGTAFAAAGRHEAVSNRDTVTLGSQLQRVLCKSLEGRKRPRDHRYAGELKAQLEDVFHGVDDDERVSTVEDLPGLRVDGFVSTQDVDLEAVGVSPAFCRPLAGLAVHFTVQTEQDQAIDPVTHLVRENAYWCISVAG